METGSVERGRRYTCAVCSGVLQVWGNDKKTVLVHLDRPTDNHEPVVATPAPIDPAAEKLVATPLADFTIKGPLSEADALVRTQGVAEHFDTPAATYRAHRPWGTPAGTREVPLWEICCSLCGASWPCDASRMADLVLRPRS